MVCWGTVKSVRMYVVLAVVLLVCATLVIAAQEPFSFQVRHKYGQNVAPVFEGWEQNSDGSFNMVFGYFDRNWEEHPYVPIGPDNRIEPGELDQGQPTYFFPRRNQFVFRVRVPQDFGEQDLVWTLTVNGKAESAYATLKPEYVLDDGIMIRNYINGTPDGIHVNERPVVSIDGEATRTTRVGEPLALTAVVSDDDLLAPRPARPGVPSLGGAGYNPAAGLRVAWFVYRGRGDQVTFAPAQFDVWDNDQGNSPWAPGWVPPDLPADGRHSVSVTFAAPGAYTLRVMAHDGVPVAKDVAVQVVE